MPFIRFSLSKNFTDQQAIAAKTELGKLITLLSGKDESKLMLEFSHCPHMFFRGDSLANGVFIDCRLYGPQPQDEKKRFAEDLYKMLETVFGIASSDIFMTFGHYNDWGSGGTLKTM